MVGPEPKKNNSLARIVNERHWDRVMRLLTSNHGGEVFIFIHSFYFVPFPNLRF